MDIEPGHELPEQAREVLDFWYGELQPEDWWTRDDGVDARIISRFSALYEQLARDVPGPWLSMPRGCLAAVIVLDQLPRNMFRGSPRAFETGAKALQIAEAAIAAGDDIKLTPAERPFLYMPFQHSEDPEIQTRSIALFQSLDDAAQLDFAIKHKEIIERFGRFPHRNDALGRVTTLQEEDFLKNPGLFW